MPGRVSGSRTHDAASPSFLTKTENGEFDEARTQALMKRGDPLHPSSTARRNTAVKAIISVNTDENSEVRDYGYSTLGRIKKEIERKGFHETTKVALAGVTAGSMLAGAFWISTPAALLGAKLAGDARRDRKTLRAIEENLPAEPK